MTGDADIAGPDLMGFKRTFTDPVPANRERAFEKAGIATYHGPGRFLSPDKLSVDGAVLEARHFVIAAGAKPRRLGVPGEEHLVTSTAFLELDQLPPRIAFVGAGYISFEVAHVARRAGAQAILVGRGRPLQHFEQDLVTRLVDHTRSLGIELRLHAEATAIEPRGAAYPLRANPGAQTDTGEGYLLLPGPGST